MAEERIVTFGSGTGKTGGSSFLALGMPLAAALGMNNAVLETSVICDPVLRF